MKDPIKELISELADEILQTHTFKISSAGVLSLNGERVTTKDLPTWLLGFSKEPGREKYTDILTKSPSLVFAVEALKTSLKAIHSKQKNKIFQGTEELVKDFSYANKIPFISIKNSKKIVFFNKDTSKLIDLDYDTYTKVVHPDYQVKPTTALLEFNPYRPEQIYIGNYDGNLCTHINTYNKPDWQEDRALKPNEIQEYAHLPEVIDEFFNHLFPNPKCKDFVYDWLHFAITSRCETYLVMNGAKGIGKNLLSNNLCASLVGKENHKIAHKGALEQFNGILAECRMIVFDEFKIVDDESINALKRYANSDQMIELKGIDVKKTEKTYNSYMICNNSVTDMKIEWDDRRFSVVDLTDKKLEDVWGSDKIKSFVDIIDNPKSEEIIGFAYWLMYRTPKVMASAFTAWKGDHFHKLCYTSLTEWAKMIVDEVTSGHPKPYYDEAELKMILKERTNGQSRFPAKNKVADFLKNYKHNGEHYLGTIEVDERTYYLQVNPEFLKKTVDSNGTTWVSLSDDLL